MEKPIDAPPLPTLTQLLHDQSTHGWVAHLIKANFQRDQLDVLHAMELLTAIYRQEWNAWVKENTL